MTSTPAPAARPGTDTAPDAGRSPGRGFLALFRADLSNYARRRSTWLPLLLALFLGLWVLYTSLTPSGYEDPSPITAAKVTTSLSALALVFSAGLGYVAGAAWMGFEHSSGALGTWLTFNPRRTRVWLSRLAVAVLVPTTLGLLGLLVAGIPGITSAKAAHSWGLTFVPHLTVVATLSALGFAIASIGRHVLWALGAFVGYSVMGWLGDALFSSADEPYLLSTALGDFIDGPPTYQNPYHPVRDVLGMAPHIAGGVIWVTFTVLVVVLALVIFRRSSID